VSERSTISVLALEMSRPFSTIVVQTSTSNSLCQNPATVRSSTSSFICPCAVRCAPRDQLAEALRDAVDRLDAVVQEEDLPLAQQLAADRGADLLLVVRARRR
jgi:hypothetical protein